MGGGLCGREILESFRSEWIDHRKRIDRLNDGFVILGNRSHISGQLLKIEPRQVLGSSFRVFRVRVDES